MKLTKSKLKKIIKEELYNPQSDDAKFSTGISVKDVNPDCPHHKSMGKVTEISGNDITYEVENLGKMFKPGDALTKSKDQLIPVNSRNIKSLGESKLRKLIRKELSEAGVADADMKAAKKLKPILEKGLESLEKLFSTIDNLMSDWNSPGMRVALINAINDGLKAHRQYFLSGAAKRSLAQYYKGR